MLVTIIALCVTLAAVDLHLALKCYEKYVVLPRLQEERRVWLRHRYIDAKAVWSVENYNFRNRVRRAARRDAKRNLGYEVHYATL